jgi:hypothetical protein
MLAVNELFGKSLRNLTTGSPELIMDPATPSSNVKVKSKSEIKVMFGT